MFQAQYLLKDDSVFGPWMEREGDSVRGVFDVVELSGVNLEIELYEKNEEDGGNGNGRSTQKKIATRTGRTRRGWGAVKELVRYRYTAISGTNAYDYVLFRTLPTTWFSAVKA